MTAAIIFLMAWIALKLAEDTPIGCFLHRIMVQLPAAAANRVSRGHVALAIVVMMLVALHLSFGDNDPVRMIGLAAPDLALWLASLEIGTIIEAAAVVAAAWTAIRRVNVASRVSRFSSRARSPRQIRRSRRSDRAPPANDDEDGTVAA